MSDAFTELERQLRRGVHNLANGPTRHTIGTLQQQRRPIRALRLGALALVLVLAATTIALAADGVILTGVPVKPEVRLNPNVGEGVPAPGTAKLLSLRASDPAGGPPWGMRLITTTRGELCVQIGRVQNGQLGVLGVDGAFKDDNAFHPLPPDALPRDVYQGHPFDSAGNETTSCQLSGQAVSGEHIGVDRSAAPKSHVWVMPTSQLRDIYFGVLGSHALSIRYRAGHSVRTQSVLQPSGAYLIVTPTRAHQQAGYGGGGLGGEGQLAPSAPLNAIVYRLAGHECERGPTLAPWQHSNIAKPCPAIVYSHHRSPFRDSARVPLKLKLHIRRHNIIGATLAFTAPFAVTSAHEDYTISSLAACSVNKPELRCGTSQMLQRNVKAGAFVTVAIQADPFQSCALPTATVEVLYGPPFGSKLRVGTTTVRRPTGAC